LTELAQCLMLRPNDSEALAVQKAWTEVVKPEAARTGAAKAPVVRPAIGAGAPGNSGEAAGAKADPLERIARGFDASAFHQAALMLDQMDASRLAALGPRERAQKLSAQAHEYLDRGLLLEAERLYQAAIAADRKAAAAHAGLAAISERNGDAKAARKEAVTSLELMPSVDAYLVLGRLNLAAGRRDEAKQNAAAALQIDPRSKPAMELKRQIEAKEGLKK
jgi:tetratricopeptide (TPR) repeat protein